MTTNILGNITAAITADASNITKAMNEAKKSVASAGDSINATATKITGAGNKIDVSISKTEKSFQRYTQSSKAAGAAARQLVPQFNDVAVSIAGGMSPLQVAMQQGSQITQVFSQMGGGIGAIKGVGSALMGMLNPVSLLTMGAIAAAGALAQYLLPKIGEWIGKNKSAEEVLKKATDAQKSLSDATKLANTPVMELRKTYGEMADEVQRAAGAMVGVRADMADIALKEVVKTQTKDITVGTPVPTRNPNITRDADHLYLNRLREYEGEIKSLGKEFGGASAEGQKLNDAQKAISSADGPEETIAASQKLLAVFEELYAANEGNEKIQSRIAEQMEATYVIIDTASAQIEAREAELNNIRDKHLGKTRELAILEQERQTVLEQIGKTVGEDQASWKVALTGIEEKIKDIRFEMSGISEITKTMVQNASEFSTNILGTMSGLRGMMNGPESAVTIGPDGKLINNNFASSGADALALAREYTGLNENTNKTELKKLLPIDPSTTAWCAAFVNAVLGRMGIQGTDSLASRSFLDYGTAVTKPEPGDIVILKRGNNNTQGHVGFYEGTNADGTINVFGGNQGNSVKSSRFKSADVLGYRRIGAADNELSVAQEQVQIDRQTAAAEQSAAAAKERADLNKKAADDATREAEKQKEISDDLARRLNVSKSVGQAEINHQNQIAAIENNRYLTDAQKAFQIARHNAELERQRFIIAEISKLENQNARTDTNVANVNAIANQNYNQAMATAQQKLAQDQYNQSLERTAEIQDTIRGGFQNIFNSVITGASSAREALAQMLQQLAQIFANRAFQSLWNGGGIAGAGGGLGGWVDRIIGGLSGGFGGFGGGDALSSALAGAGVKGFANGGVASGLYMAGERGAELIHSSGRDRVYNASQTQKLLNGTGGATSIQVSLSPDLKASILSESHANAVKVTKSGLADYNKNIPRRIDQYSRDPRLK